MPPLILKTIPDLRNFVKKQRAMDQRIALVPTMGALHEGHMALIRAGLAQADCVITSIFVNPAQFGPNEDLSAYPRTEDKDLKKLTSLGGTQAVFSPMAKEIYPDGFQSKISVSGLSDLLEGVFRPGHFDGVATVIAKLLIQCLPDRALFGEKDWQQLQVIKQMVRDLNMPVKIIGVKTRRDENGVALSSRNSYLDEAQYKIACCLNEILFAMVNKIKSGDALCTVEQWGMSKLEKSGFDSIDYLEICDAQTLQKSQTGNLRILAAVKIGKARLIDNVSVE